MSNWEKRESRSHPSRVYYLNQNTGVSQWGIPNSSSLIPLPPDWERHRSRHFNKIYYENVKTSKTQWDPPFGKTLPFILFGDNPNPYDVLDNLDSNWKYGICITPIFTNEVFIKKIIQDPHPWGELNIPCSQFISINSEKAKVCLQKLMSIENPQVKSVDINRWGLNNAVKTYYKHSPNANSLFDYFSDNFIVGNKYEILENTGPEIYEYFGRGDYKTIEEDGKPYVFRSDSDIKEFEIPNIKYEECHIFKSNSDPDIILLKSNANQLGKLKMHIPPIDYLSTLSNIDEDQDIQKIEQSSINILKKLFIETYYKSHINEKKFREYTRQIILHEYRLFYDRRLGNTYIKYDNDDKYEPIYELLRDLSNTPKAESDFYVFRANSPRIAYESEKIISGEVIEEKMFTAISTSIISKFPSDWIGKQKPCCIYLIRVPKNENYLILADVFTKTNHELQLNNESQYEVTLAPGKLTFTDIKKITIDGYEKALFVCDYKSFTEEEFKYGFAGPIYKYNPTRQAHQEFDFVQQLKEEEELEYANKASLKYNVNYLDKKDCKNYEYALEEIKKTEWEYSFVARLDEKEKNTRSLIFISKTLGIRAYFGNIFYYTSGYDKNEENC